MTSKQPILFGFKQQFYKSELTVAYECMADQEKIINEVLNASDQQHSNYQQFNNAMKKLRGLALSENFMANQQAQQLYLQIYKKVVGNSFERILAKENLEIRELVTKLTVNEYQFWKYQTQLNSQTNAATLK